MNYFINLLVFLENKMHLKNNYTIVRLNLTTLIQETGRWYIKFIEERIEQDAAVRVHVCRY